MESLFDTTSSIPSSVEPVQLNPSLFRWFHLFIKFEQQELRINHEEYWESIFTELQDICFLSTDHAKFRQLPKAIKHERQRITSDIPTARGSPYLEKPFSGRITEIDPTYQIERS